MKILVVSDSHGIMGSFSDVLKKHARGCDAVFHLGDGCDDMLCCAEYIPAVPTYICRGNCDRYPINQPMPRVITTIGSKRIFACHGHAYSVKEGLASLYYAAQEQQADIALYGHTHLQDLRETDGIILLNPGSAADGRCAVIEIEDGKTQVTLY